MRRCRCETAAVLIFGVGFGLSVGLLLSSSFITGLLGFLLMAIGILLAFKK